MSAPHPLRIGIDARMYSSQFTGIGRYNYELIAELARLDGQTQFVIFLNPAQAAQFVPPGPNFRAVAVAAGHYSLAEQTTFLAALYRQRLDLVHFTHFNAPLFYLRPSVVTIHDLTLSKFPGKKMNSWLHRAAYNLVVRRAVWHARHILTVSQNTACDLQTLLRVSPAKITVTYNGVGSEFRPAADRASLLKELQKKYDLKDEFLLYTGVWRDHKNLLGLLSAVQILREKHGWTGQLVLTGRPDPVYAPALLARVAELKLEDVVRLPGLVPEADLRALYQTARVYVFPSFYEGFGLPPLEAMASGTPVAVSNASCLPEVCGAENAVFFDPYSPADMAAKIASVWVDDALRQKLVARGLARVQQFGWTELAQKTLAVYKKALQII